MPFKMPVFLIFAIQMLAVDSFAKGPSCARFFNWDNPAQSFYATPVKSRITSLESFVWEKGRKSPLDKAFENGQFALDHDHLRPRGNPNTKALETALREFLKTGVDAQVDLLVVLDRSQHTSNYFESFAPRKRIGKERVLAELRNAERELKFGWELTAINDSKTVHPIYQDFCVLNVGGNISSFVRLLNHPEYGRRIRFVGPYADFWTRDGSHLNRFVDAFEDMLSRTNSYNSYSSLTAEERSALNDGRGVDQGARDSR